MVVEDQENVEEEEAEESGIRCERMRRRKRSQGRYSVFVQSRTDGTTNRTDNWILRWPGICWTTSGCEGAPLLNN